MKSFKEFIDRFKEVIALQEVKAVLGLIVSEDISFEKMPFFTNSLTGNFAASLTIMSDARGLILEFYNLVDKEGFLNYLDNEMLYKTTIDQTSRDNIYLTVFEPKFNKGFSKIELISREELEPNNIQMEEVEAVSILINH